MDQPVGIYLRISDDPLNLRAGITRQRADCQTIAATRFPGHPIREYVDNDISAYTGVLRPAYQQLLADIAAGQLHAAIAWDQDRLLRLSRELEPLIQLCDSAAFSRLLTASGDLDLTTHEGQFRARIMVAVAQKSSDDTSRRVRRAALDRAERGKWLGKAPYGYTQAPDSTLGIDPTAATTIRAAITLIGQGASLRHLTRRFPDGPATGPSWVKTLTNPALCGLNRHGRVGDWEPIITRQQHADLVAHFADPARRTSTRTSYRTHWLTGILTCGRCESASLTFQPMPRSKAGNYVCTNCHGVSVSAAAVEPIVADWLFDAAPGRETATAEPEDPAVAAQAEERLSELAAMYAAGELSRAEWVAARGAIPKATSSSATTSTADIPIHLREAWGQMTIPHRRLIAGHYLLSIAVMPGSRGSFDAARLQPKWRV